MHRIFVLLLAVSTLTANPNETADLFLWDELEEELCWSESEPVVREQEILFDDAETPDSDIAETDD